MRVVSVAAVALVLAALFTAYGGSWRPAPVHWVSDRVDVPLLRD